MKFDIDFKINKSIFQSGKDTLVKFWDLDIRHCFKTIVTHRSEVCDLVLINDERLITGCHDNQLRVFKIEFKEDNDETSEEAIEEKRQKVDEENDEDIDEENVRSQFLFSSSQ
jgi:U3 small nucleolar RNA-associated protein 12